MRSTNFTPYNLLQVRGLTHAYNSGPALIFPDFDCQSGEKLLLIGNSGTGKTTLLHLMSGLLHIQMGEISIEGHQLERMSQKELDMFRGKNMGIVFQQSRFIRALSVVENVLAAQYFSHGKSDEKKATKHLEALGISKLASKKTSDLSGGERQRLAIARALAAEPVLLFADEPTSSLDDTNANRVYELLCSESQRNGVSLIIVSHDQRLKSKFANQVSL